MTAAPPISNPPAAASPAAPALVVKFPTIGVAAVALILGCQEKEVWEHIEDGSLQNAFNLAVRARLCRRFIRVLARSVLDFKAGVKCTLSQVEGLNLIFPAARQRFTATEVAWAWACDSQHVHDLIALGELQKVPGTGDTVNRAPFIPRPSLADFLTKRRIT
jgi:hypothetical protein